MHCTIDETILLFLLYLVSYVIYQAINRVPHKQNHKSRYVDNETTTIKTFP